MVDNPGLDKALKFGYYSAMALSIWTLITFLFAMFAIPPAGPYCPGDCMSYPYADLLDYYPRDYYWMILAVFQLFIFIIFISSNHVIATADQKIIGTMSSAFGLISSGILLITYFTQFSIVPISVLSGETEGIALLTQYNGHGLFIALEELGYITMSISLFFLAWLFSGNNRLEKAIRWILMSPLLVSVLAFIFYSVKYGIDRDYRFEVATITINWVVLIVIGLLISIHFKNKMKTQTQARLPD